MQSAATTCAQQGTNCPVMQIWCENFLGSDTAPNACCDKDDTIALDWCLRSESQSDSRFPEVCDPSNLAFGDRNWVYTNGTLDVAPLASLAGAESESGFCEVLGRVRLCHNVCKFTCFRSQHDLGLLLVGLQ